jgi:hypothetical protein
MRIARPITRFSIAVTTTIASIATFALPGAVPVNGEQLLLGFEEGEIMQPLARPTTKSLFKEGRADSRNYRCAPLTRKAI